MLHQYWKYVELRENEIHDKNKDENEDEIEQICPECSSDYIIMDEVRSEKTCYNCGIVIEERMINPKLSVKFDDKNKGRR